ncbi:MAG: alpha/beta fold hydrolase [Acidobacteriota bacterium]
MRSVLRPAFIVAALALTLTAAPPIAHETATVNGVTLHYARSGSGQLMLFLHGFPEFWYGWKAHVEEFGRDHLAVAPDMRGYNLSSKPPEVDQYSVPLLVEDVRALAAHLGHGTSRKFVLVGHDWGGVVAWAYAMMHPDTIEKLIIVNAPHPGVFQRELRENPAQQKASAYMLMFRGPQAEQTLSANNYEMLVRIVLGEGLARGRVSEADKQAYLSAWAQPGALTGGLNYYRAAQVGPPTDAQQGGASPPPLVPSSAKVTVPTLVIWGEKDTALLTGNLEGLETFVPQLTIRRIPDGTHWVIHEKPDEVTRHIREFIAR